MLEWLNVVGAKVQVPKTATALKCLLLLLLLLFDLDSTAIPLQFDYATTI